MTGILPARLLTANIISLDQYATWDENDGDGDPFVGQPYQWTLTANIYTQTHSSPYTQTPLAYTTSDIIVGDWIANTKNGNALQIKQILDTSNDVLVAIVEDIDRFNTFSDPTQNGQGVIGTGFGVVFTLNDDGFPILEGVPSGYLDSSFQTDLMSRFEYRNSFKKYIRVNQANHGMNIGDPIILNSDGTYSKAAGNSTADKLIGIVTSINIPGTSWFTYRPIGTLIQNISPALPGQQGDIIYLGTTAGTYTNICPTSNAKAIYIQVDSAGTQGILIQQSLISPQSEIIEYSVDPTDAQTVFTVPTEAANVIEMTINGIELKPGVEFTFDINTHTVTVNTTAVGYGIEVTDEVMFLYKT